MGIKKRKEKDGKTKDEVGRRNNTGWGDSMGEGCEGKEMVEASGGGLRQAWVH